MARVNKVIIEYKGKQVKANKLTLSSTFDLPVAEAWKLLQTPDLLLFITQGMIKFIPVSGYFPESWQQGTTFKVKMRIFGFIPFGGVHVLHFQTIDEDKHTLTTREYDAQAKVWDHTISMSPTKTNQTFYTDEIVIYGGMLTGFITQFAKIFYKHRQKRWHKVAANGLQQ